MSIILRVVLFIFFLAYLAFFGWGLYSSTDEYREIFIRMLTSAAGLSIIVAFFALWLTLENFLRKTNLNIRGKFELNDQKIKFLKTFDQSVTQFQLSNYKDKNVLIYDVYLKVKTKSIISIKKPYYIHLKSYSNNPLILKAYDSVSEKMTKVLAYEHDGQGYWVGDYLCQNKLTLILNTNEGKYEVKKFIKSWMPSKLVSPITIVPEYKVDPTLKFSLSARHQWSIKVHDSLYYYQIYHSDKELKIDGYLINVDKVNTEEELLENIQIVMKGVFDQYQIKIFQSPEIINKNYPQLINIKNIKELV